MVYLVDGVMTGRGVEGLTPVGVAVIRDTAGVDTPEVGGRGVDEASSCVFVLRSCASIGILEK